MPGLESRLLALSTAIFLAAAPAYVKAGDNSIELESIDLSGYTSIKKIPLNISYSGILGLLGGIDLDSDDNYDITVDYSTRRGLSVQWHNLADKIRNDQKLDLNSITGFGIMNVENPTSPYVFGDKSYFVIDPSFDLFPLLNPNSLLVVDINNSSMDFLTFDDQDKKYFIHDGVSYNPASRSFEQRQGHDEWVLAPVAISIPGFSNEQRTFSELFHKYPELLKIKICEVYPNENITQVLDDFRIEQGARWGIINTYSVNLMRAIHDVVSVRVIAGINNSGISSNAFVPWSEVTSSPPNIPQSNQGIVKERWYKNPYVITGGGLGVAGGIITAILLNKDNKRTVYDKPDKIVPSTGVQDVRGN